MIPFRTDAPTRGSPVITMSFILANITVYFYQLGLSPSSELKFIFSYALVPAFVTDPSVIDRLGLKTIPYLTLVSNTFMHGGALHLIFNIWTLWLFGAPLEGQMGRVRFVFFYLLCGAVGSLGHYAFNADSTIPALGASGAIAGVLGGYTLLFPKARVQIIQPIFFFPLVFPLPAWIYTVVWFGIQVYQGTADLNSRGAEQMGGIAWFAHIGGFVAGVILVWLLCRHHHPTPKPAPKAATPPQSTNRPPNRPVGRSRIPSAGGNRTRKNKKKKDDD